MARARNIKPAFFQNDLLVELDFETRLLFIGLWTLADREGRIEYRPKKIKMEVFPADSVDVIKGLDGLASLGFLKIYEVNGLKIILVLNFSKHQSPHGSERDSILPNEDGLFTIHERKKKLITGISWLSTTPSDVKEPSDNGIDTVRKPSDNALNPDCGILNPDCGILNPDCLNHEPRQDTPNSAQEESAPDEMPIVCLVLRNLGVSIAEQKRNLPKIKTLLHRGATLEDFTAGLEVAKSAGKGFAYALGVVGGRLDDVQQPRASPRQGGRGGKMTREDYAAVPDASLAEHRQKLREQTQQGSQRGPQEFLHIDDGKTLEAS